MLSFILYIIIGCILVIWGADRLTEGAVGIAQRLNVPQIIIGLTVVAFGTSMPEFCVSMVSAINGSSDLAVGNIVGSNIFNELAIVGVVAVVCPMAILRSTVARDLPFAILCSIVLAIECIDGSISRIDATVLIVLFIVYMTYTLKGARKGGAKSYDKKVRALWLDIIWTIIGLAALIGGSEVFVNGATGIAHGLGVSDAVIGLTVVAIGTSLPELATSVVSARKGQSGIAIGNVIGSNIFNILFILGTTGLVCPMSLSNITPMDFYVMIGGIVALFVFCRTKYLVQRWEGFVMIAAITAYIAWLVINA